MTTKKDEQAKVKKGKGKKAMNVADEEGYITVTATLLGQTRIADAKVKVRPFVEGAPVARVRARRGCTFRVNSDYEFERIDCEIEIPCYVPEVVGAWKEICSVAGTMVYDTKNAILSELSGRATEQASRESNADETVSIEDLLSTADNQEAEHAGN